MKENLGATVIRLGVFMAVCGLGLFAMLAIFAELRFEEETVYHAQFRNVSGLRSGDFVRIAGVEVGRVQRIAVEDDGTVLVDFTADGSVVLTEGSRAVVRYKNLIGDRYLALREGTGGTRQIPPGGTIPLTRTAPALDLDALVGGFRPLFHALDPGQVNTLTGQLVKALQGEGPTIRTFFEQVARLTNTLADRDRLIREVIGNLDTVLGSLDQHSTEFAGAIDSLTQLLGTLAARKVDLRNGIAYADASALSISDLISRARPPLTKVIGESDRTATVTLADRDYLDNLLNTLPQAYRMLNRQGLYGDYFSFYLCDLVLKLNGKGGQPVYVKVAGQSTGRCTPR